MTDKDFDAAAIEPAPTPEPIDDVDQDEDLHPFDITISIAGVLAPSSDEARRRVLKAMEIGTFGPLQLGAKLLNQGGDDILGLTASPNFRFVGPIEIDAQEGELPSGFGPEPTEQEQD